MSAQSHPAQDPIALLSQPKDTLLEFVRGDQTNITTNSAAPPVVSGKIVPASSNDDAITASEEHVDHSYNVRRVVGSWLRNVIGLQPGNGRLALYALRGDHSSQLAQDQEWRILDTQSANNWSWGSGDGYLEVNWLDTYRLRWLRSNPGNHGWDLWIGNAEGEKQQYCAGTIKHARVFELRTELIDDNTAVVYYYAYEDDLAYNQSRSERDEEMREYECPRVLDEYGYSTGHELCLWYTALHFSPMTDQFTLQEKAFKLFDAGVLDYMGAIDFSSGLVVVAAGRPQLGNHVSSHAYIQAIGDPSTAPGAIYCLTKDLPGESYSITSVAVSEDSKHVAFARCPVLDSSFGNTVIHILDIDGDEQCLLNLDPTILEIEGVRKPDEFDLVPLSLSWSSDARSIYFRAECQGPINLYKVDISQPRSLRNPLKLTKIEAKNDSVASLHLVRRPLPAHEDFHHFIETHSLVQTNTFRAVPLQAALPNHNEEFVYWSSWCDTVISDEQISRIQWKSSSRKYMIEGFVIKPPKVESKTSWPVYIGLHGGPFSSWPSHSREAGECRIAEEGYIVILPNISGSTGYGTDFQRAGDLNPVEQPTRDIADLLDHLKLNCPECDMSRIVLSGFSHGSYLAQWIAGQSLAARFTTFICESGIFERRTRLSNDVPPVLTGNASNIYFTSGEMFWPWPRQDRINPSTYASKWHKPMLFMHGGEDTRVSVANSIMAYNVCLQRGLKSRLVIFPAEKHGLSDAKWESYLKIKLRWMNQMTNNSNRPRLHPAQSDGLPWGDRIAKVDLIEKDTRTLKTEVVNRKVRMNRAGADF